MVQNDPGLPPLAGGIPTRYVVLQLYGALIATLLLMLLTQRRPTKRQLEAIHLYFVGFATEEEPAARTRFCKKAKSAVTGRVYSNAAQAIVLPTSPVDRPDPTTNPGSSHTISLCCRS